MDENRFARSLDSKYTNTATNTSTATSTAGQMPMEFLAGAVIHEGQFTIPPRTVNTLNQSPTTSATWKRNGKGSGSKTLIQMNSDTRTCTRSVFELCSLVTRAGRFRVLKWARFVFRIVCLFVCCCCFFLGGGDFRSYADWFAAS